MKNFASAFHSSICMNISADSHMDLNLTLSNMSWEKFCADVFFYFFKEKQALHSMNRK